MKKQTPTDQQTPFAIHSKSANDPVSTKEIHTIAEGTPKNPGLEGAVRGSGCLGFSYFRRR
jgi:hypothetical protein